MSTGTGAQHKLTGNFGPAGWRLWSAIHGRYACSWNLSGIALVFNFGNPPPSHRLFKSAGVRGAGL